jgi:hypothetical protein
MDEFDRAQIREMQERDLSVALARRKQGPGLLPVGGCHYCGEEINLPKLFCDSECAEEWETERRRLGK